MKKKTFLTPSQKREVGRLAATGRFTTQELADKFDISKSTALKLVAASINGGPTAEDAANDLITLGAMIQDARRLAEKLGYTLTLSKD